MTSATTITRERRRPRDDRRPQAGVLAGLGEEDERGPEAGSGSGSRDPSREVPALARRLVNIVVLAEADQRPGPDGHTTPTSARAVGSSPVDRAHTTGIVDATTAASGATTVMRPTARPWNSDPRPAVPAIPAAALIPTSLADGASVQGHRQQQQTGEADELGAQEHGGRRRRLEASPPKKSPTPYPAATTRPRRTATSSSRP